MDVMRFLKHSLVPHWWALRVLPKGMLKAIERAIQASDLGLTPNSDGKVIRLLIPELTEERRKDLTKLVHKACEEAKVAIRAIRRRESREKAPPTPIYTLTANAMPEHAQASSDAGADGHITKPITADGLLRVVEQVWNDRAGSAVQDNDPLVATA